MKDNFHSLLFFFNYSLSIVRSLLFEVLTT